MRNGIISDKVLKYSIPEIQEEGIFSWSTTFSQPNGNGSCNDDSVVGHKEWPYQAVKNDVKGAQALLWPPEVMTMS